VLPPGPAFAGPVFFQRTEKLVVADAVVPDTVAVHVAA
jgi:hypothetical protein